jgi:hypothetical protein
MKRWDLFSLEIIPIREHSHVKISINVACWPKKFEMEIPLLLALA